VSEEPSLDTFERRKTAKIPVWLMAPTGRDAELLKASLAGKDGVRIARDASDLERGFAERGQVGVLVLTQEALVPATIRAIERHLRAQEPWENLPIILLVDPLGNTMGALASFQDALPRTKILVLQRPVHLSELQTAVETMRSAKLRQRDLGEYIERQELLRRELNHRVRNILATVQALYGLTVRNASSLEQFDSVFQPRLSAMARVHEVLFAANYGRTRIELLVDAVLAPFDPQKHFFLSGDETEVSAEAGQSIALIVHELVSNSIAHGALSSEEGRVRLSWSGDDQLRIHWQEEGGPSPAAPAHEGYGMSFMRATARTLGGEAVFDFGENGLRARFVLAPNRGS
jgi:two-component sensor histidine kinase